MPKARNNFGLPNSTSDAFLPFSAGGGFLDSESTQEALIHAETKGGC